MRKVTLVSLAITLSGFHDRDPCVFFATIFTQKSFNAKRHTTFGNTELVETFRRHGSISAACCANLVSIFKKKQCLIETTDLQECK